VLPAKRAKDVIASTVSFEPTIKETVNFWQDIGDLQIEPLHSGKQINSADNHSVPTKIWKYLTTSTPIDWKRVKKSVRG
jgi:hypothetical protein